jgi:hypothetical protein
MLRERFEEWAKDFVKSRLDGDGTKYSSPYTQAAWEGWQAAWAWGALQASDETERYRAALTKIEGLIDSEPDVPHDEAINIAGEALHCKNNA